MRIVIDRQLSERDARMSDFGTNGLWFDAAGGLVFIGKIKRNLMRSDLIC